MWIKQRTSVHYIILQLLLLFMFIIPWIGDRLLREDFVQFTMTTFHCGVTYLPQKFHHLSLESCFLWTLTYYSFILLSFQFHCHVWKMNWHPQVSDRQDVMHLNLCSFLYMLNTRLECCRLVCGRCCVWILAGTYPDGVFLVFLSHCRKIPE